LKTPAYFFLLALAALLFYGCPPPAATASVPTADGQRPFPPGRDVPKNVILMIGDGMGVAQITAAMIRNENELNLERFPVVGLQKTYSADNLITDSAAGATAMGAGVKTYNAAVGITADTVAVETIAEEAKRRNYATGLVVTSTIVHATPASFLAHNKFRYNYEEIALSFSEAEVDLLIGGGLKYFGMREDGLDLVQRFRDRGFRVSDFTEEDIAEMSMDTDRPLVYFTAADDPITAARGRNYLAPASVYAYSYLKQRSDKGFFLMIEGSQIDWGGHANNSETIISEMLDFDETIGFILDLARKDKETLVIVTADHETGGYAINPNSTPDSIVAGFTTDSHTAEMVPVFAYGPGAENFAGIYENTEIYEKMRKLLFARRRD
jgi:alkaline phosphatase